jgi:ABC superfamily ATP binding cassette transporter, permease protein
LKQIVVGVGSAVLLLELLVGAVVFQEKIALLALVGASLFLQLFYLPYQLKRLVDE